MLLAWLVIALAGFGSVALALILWLMRSSPRKSAKSKVCDVWNRWRRLPKDHTAPKTARKRGDGWEGDVCPKGRHMQVVNRNDVHCVTDPEESTNLLCDAQISNDDVALAIAPQVDPHDPRAGVDHWITLKESIAMPGLESFQGDAWDGNVCPSGAAFQQLEDEGWCVIPDHLAQATEAAQ